MSDEKELKVKITGDDQLSPALRRAHQAMGELHTGTLNLAAGLTILQTGTELAKKAWEALEGQFDKAVEAAIANEKANTKLTGALVSTGQFSTQTQAAIDKYAQTLLRTDGAQVSTTKTLVGMAVQMGLTVPQAEKMEEASRKLAAATGKDVHEAFAILQQTFLGHSRELGRILPQVQELGTAQMKTGAAIDVVNRALDAQYKLYQTTFSSSLESAHASIETVYESFGKLIIQNPIAQRGVQQFTEFMLKLAEKIEQVGEFIKEHQEQIERLMGAFAKASAVIVGVVAAMAAASEAAVALGAAWAFLTGPIGLTMLAIGALTAALYKWPGLFDIIIGSFKALAGGMLAIATGPLMLLLEGARRVAQVFDKDLANSILGVEQKIGNFEASTIKAGTAQVALGVQSIKTGQQVKKAEDDHTDAVNKNLKAVSERNKVLLDTQKAYAGYAIGTFKQRQALAAQVQDRDQDLSDFKKYLDAKERLAISKEQEQQAELAKVRQGAVKGTGGPQENIANAEVEKNNELQKQQFLREQYRLGVINFDQYLEAKRASEQRYNEQSVAETNAYIKAKADAMGESEEGFALRMKVQQDQGDLEQQALERKLNAAGATQEEHNAAMSDLEAQQQQKELDDLDAHYAKVAAREEISGQTVLATQQKYFRSQEKAQADNIKNFASGVSVMTSIQSAYNTTTQKLGDALIKHQKISARAMTGVFLEALGRKVQQEGFANLIMGIFPPNPVQLGVGAAEVALGTAIGREGVSMQGGQGDKGNDDISQQLSGQSFVVSGGERIVQPEANRDLKDFLKREKTGAAGTGGNNYNISLSYSGSASKDDVEKMADMLVEEIRKRSERGSQIVSSRGVYSS